MTNTLNYELKQNGYAFLEQGYAFPNTSIMKDKAKARNITERQVQILHERVEWTADNRPKFVHPPSKHNDLNHAWEMSLKAVRDFQMGRIGEVEKGMYDGYDTQEITDYTMPSWSFAIPYEEDEHGASFDMPYD